MGLTITHVFHLRCNYCDREQEFVMSDEAFRQSNTDELAEHVKRWLGWVAFREGHFCPRCRKDILKL